MGKCKNATKAGRGVQRDTSPTSLFCGDEPEDSTHNKLEDVSSQMGTSPKAPFIFMQSSRLPSLQSLSPEGRWACLMTSDIQIQYCFHIRVTQGRGWPTSTFPCLEWITNCQHVPGWSWRTNHWNCGPGTRRSNLVLWKMIVQRGAPLHYCKRFWIELDRSS